VSGKGYEMLRRLLPHLCLVCSIMMLVFIVIDQINPAMRIIGGNDVFNHFLLIFTLLVLVTSLWTICDHRRQC
jgi:hypothetical protein